MAGISLDPTVNGVAPFVYSGGGNLFDSTSQPTSLAFSDDANLSVADPDRAGAARARHQPDRRHSWREHSPLEWFMRGKLALLEGTRRMVPDLRATPGLDFDVMPMPSLGTSATVGSLTGLCVSQHATDVATAADFLVYASSPGALALVSFGGYLQPANQTVALSDAFQQPARPPRHASVFTFSVKSMVYPPVIGQWDELELAVDPLVQTAADRQAVATWRGRPRRIDRASYRILGPRLGPSASPELSRRVG